VSKKPSTYQLSVLSRLIGGEELKARRTMTIEGRCVGLGTYRWKNGGNALFVSLLAMRDHGFVKMVDRSKVITSGYGKHTFRMKVVHSVVRLTPTGRKFAKLEVVT